MAAKDKGLLESVREKIPGGGSGDDGIHQGRRKALMKIGGAGAAAIGGNFAAEELTGRSLVERGEGIVSGGREPVDEAPANDTVNPNNPGYNNSKPGNTSNGTENQSVGNRTDTGSVDTPEELTGRQLYFDWIHGENEEILEENKGEHGEISFNAVNNALEDGFEQGGRNQAIANALETASQEYQENTSYEDRHRHILSALHTTLEQKEGDQWNFDIFSNMNYTQTVATTIQYSEIKVQTGETTDTGEDEYAIINAALSDKMEHATHIPGEDKGDDGYKRTMSGVRESHNDTDLPPHDVEALEKRERTSDNAENVPESGAPLTGYQLFAGGHRVDSGFEYRPDEMLVPASKDIHKKIDEIGYEQGNRVDREGNPLGTHGRMDLQLAINERYMNEGYDEVDGPVVIDKLEETEDGWEFELKEEPDWNWEQGYPATAL